jgi:hypothetical protein
MINKNLENYKEFKEVSIETRIHAIIRNRQKQAGDKYLFYKDNDCYIFGALIIPKFKKYIGRVYREKKLFLQFSTYDNEVIEIDSSNLIKLQERLEANGLSYDEIEDAVDYRLTIRENGLFDSFSKF